MTESLVAAPSRVVRGGVDVFDEIAEVVHDQRVMAARQLALVARAADP